jgi:hypothetical protein
MDSKVEMQPPADESQGLKSMIVGLQPALCNTEELPLEIGMDPATSFKPMPEYQWTRIIYDFYWYWGPSTSKYVASIPDLVAQEDRLMVDMVMTRDEVIAFVWGLLHDKKWRLVWMFTTQLCYMLDSRDILIFRWESESFTVKESKGDDPNLIRRVRNPAMSFYFITHEELLSLINDAMSAEQYTNVKKLAIGLIGCPERFCCGWTTKDNIPKHQEYSIAPHYFVECTFY